MRTKLTLTTEAGSGIEGLLAQQCFSAAVNACLNLNLSYIQNVGIQKCSLSVEGPVRQVQELFVKLASEFYLEQI